MGGSAGRPIVIAASIVLVLGLILSLVAVDRHLFRASDWSVPDDLDAAAHLAMFQQHRLEHAIWSLQQQKEGFEWHLRSAIYIFWVTILISVSGIAFAFWQFARAELFDRAAAEADEMEVRTQMASLSFRSRSVASLVLFVSIAYLALYTIVVHPMRVLDIGTVIQMGPAPSDAARATSPPPPAVQVLDTFEILDDPVVFDDPASFGDPEVTLETDNEEEMP